MAKNSKTTRNPRSPLFKKLTKLLSGPLVNYRTQFPRKMKRAQLDKYKDKFQAGTGQHFKKAIFNPFDGLH